MEEGERPQAGEGGDLRGDQKRRGGSKASKHNRVRACCAHGNRLAETTYTVGHSQNGIQAVMKPAASLLPVPCNSLPAPPHLLLQLEHAIEERLGRWRAAWHVEVNGDDAVTTSDDRVRVVVVSACVE